MVFQHKTTDEPYIVPFFQPIISLQNQRIIGYESLGRKLIDNKPMSLGPFFHNRAIDENDHLYIDRLLREKAIARLAEMPDGCMLFVNIRPSWIVRANNSDSPLPTLQLIDKYNVDPGRIVIEITEDESQGTAQELSDIVMSYRRHGCKIAIDDVGSGFSNFDRIALIRPDIIKVDLKLMRKSRIHEGYQALLRSYSILAEQIGASLLMEGIETERELCQALSIGARYVQGFLFASASASLHPADRFADMLREQLSLYAGEQLAKYQELLAVNHLFDSLISYDLKANQSEEADRYIEQLLGGVPQRCIRIYLCSEDGVQVSSNYCREGDGSWLQDSSFRGANWLWRPYFIPNIVRMQNHPTPTLSQIYTDLETSKIMHTYSGSIGNGLYLFFDLVV